MNDNFTQGFIKAAKARGLSDSQIQALYKRAVDGLEQLDPAAAGGLPQGAAEQPAPTPGAGAPPEGGIAAGVDAPAPAEAAAGIPPEAGAEGGEGGIEHLLSQLSPEELEQLATELAGDMGQGGEEGAAAGGDGEVAQLAKAIAEHLHSNPEASLPGADAAGAAPVEEAAEGGAADESGAPQDPAEAAAMEQLAAKTSALNYVKSAEYIEGFLSRAVEHGVNVKTAVDMYDHALVTTIGAMSSPDYIVDASFTKRASANEIDEKTAAYYEGVIERAREYGISDKVAFELVYETLEKQSATPLRSGSFKAQAAHANYGKPLAKKAPSYSAFAGDVPAEKLNPRQQAQKITDARAAEQLAKEAPTPAAATPAPEAAAAAAAPATAAATANPAVEQTAADITEAAQHPEIAKMMTEDPVGFAKAWAHIKGMGSNVVGAGAGLGKGIADFTTQKPGIAIPAYAGGAALGGAGLTAALSGGGDKK